MRHACLCNVYVQRPLQIASALKKLGTDVPLSALTHMLIANTCVPMQ